MASTAASWSPSSLQLRLALNCGNRRVSRTVLVRTLAGRIDGQVRLFSVARNGDEAKLRRNGVSWIRSDSGADTFAGWSDADNSEPSIDSQRKQWFGGFVGAGVAGVVIVAGLTLATISLSKQSTSRSKQQMEPLTTHQEVSLAYDNGDNKVGENENTGDGVIEDDGSLESKTGTEKAFSASSELYSVASESKIDNEYGIHLTAIKDASHGCDDVSDSSDSTLGSYKLPVSDITSDSLVASTFEGSDGKFDENSPEPTLQSEHNIVNDKESDVSNRMDYTKDQQEGPPDLKGKENFSVSSGSADSSSASFEPIVVSFSESSEVDTFETQIFSTSITEAAAPSSNKDNLGIKKLPHIFTDRNNNSLEVNDLSESGSSKKSSVSKSSFQPLSKEVENGDKEPNENKSSFESSMPRHSLSPTGIPAPSAVAAALPAHPGKVLVPAVVDQVQAHALAALQALKVIEADAQPGNLCTRREYARWLVSASSALSRNTVSKVYPAMFIEDITELAFDDVTPKDPDFPSIQGLAEAGLISSKLSNRDLLNEDEGSFYFFPESPLSRQDVVSWKMALEKRQLPDADKKVLYQLSGFIDIDKINPDAWPALIADLSSGEMGIISLAFGCTRLFQPDKPVTNAQAAVALATGEASDVVSEELARIEAESVAENAVAAHNALVAQVEQDIHANFEKELSMEREKIDAVEKMAEEARHEMDRLRAQRDEDNIALMKERAAIESEMEVLTRLRREVEVQLESLMTNKVEVSYEKERMEKLKQEAEKESQEISRLQYELEVERKALAMARAWAEDEAKRAREQAKALEEARDRWERQGIKVVVDNDLREASSAGVTWLNVEKQISVEGTVSRSQIVMDKLKKMASDVEGKSRELINKIVEMIQLLVAALMEWTSRAVAKAEELKETSMVKVRTSIQQLQHDTSELAMAVKEGTKRMAGDCREGVEKLAQKFKT